MSKITQFLTFSLMSIVAYGQHMVHSIDEQDLVHLQYEVFPNLNEVQIENKGVAIDFTSLLKEPTIGFGLSYSNYNIDFSDNTMNKRFAVFETLHHLQVYAKYKKELTNNWRADITVAPFLASTFSEKIAHNDFVFSYAASMVKTWEKEGLQSYLKLGAGYGALFGKPSFYPLISYSNTITEKFRYEIGIPITGAFYKINDQNTIDLKAEPKSIYANSTSEFSLENHDILYDSTLQFSAIQLSLGYKFEFDSNWSTYFNVGYLTASDVIIENNDNTVFDFDSNDSMSLNIGISFNINKK